MTLDQFDELWQEYMLAAQDLFARHIGRVKTEHSLEAMHIGFRCLHKDHAVLTGYEFPFICFKVHPNLRPPLQVELAVYPRHPYGQD